MLLNVVIKCCEMLCYYVVKTHKHVSLKITLFPSIEFRYRHQDTTEKMLLLHIYKNVF